LARDHAVAQQLALAREPGPGAGFAASAARGAHRALLGPAGALSLLVHAAVLALWMGAAGSPAPLAPAAAPMTVRLIDGAAAIGRALSVPEQPDAPSTPPTAANPSDPPADRRAAPVAAAEPTSGAVASKSASAQAAPAEPAGLAAAGTTAGADAQAPVYLATGLLAPPPRPLQDIEPPYPEIAGQREGTVVLRLRINEGGTVDEVSVVRSFPEGLFDEAASAAFGAARFSPGYSMGVAVKSELLVEVHFQPLNRGSTVSGRRY
jgi:protein TonB